MLRRVIEERAAGERQRPHQPVAERIMKHRRASSRRVEADLLLTLQHRDLRMSRKRRGRREARDSAANDQDVGVMGH